MIIKKSYKTVDEFYSAVESLVVSLRKQGFDSEAQRIDVILHGTWTTGSELIGELMLYLAEMKLNVPKETQRVKDDCHYFAKHHRKILKLD